MGLGAIGLMFNPKGYDKFTSCVQKQIPQRPAKGTLNGPDSMAARCCRTTAGPTRCHGAGHFVEHVGNICPSMSLLILAYPQRPVVFLPHHLRKMLAPTYAACALWATFALCCRACRPA